MTAIKWSKLDFLNQNLEMGNGFIYYSTIGNGGFRFPWYSEAEKIVYGNTRCAGGEVIFNTDTKKLNLATAQGVWEVITSS